ncbi:hypothetical protein F5Y12DRAFT_711317 [Xylaria sp. FL1777]|nr:hypothetical protein F5Y12DRAFT_711317 [Xylaria sp. FL1777]
MTAVEIASFTSGSTEDVAEETPRFVTEELMKPTANAKERQSVLGLYNKLRWVGHDRDEFHRQLKNIEKGNQQLESLLMLHSDVDPSPILGAVDNEDLESNQS